MTEGSIVEPLRIGVLGAGRITSLSLVAPARSTGHRLVAVAARWSVRLPCSRPKPRPPASPGSVC